MSPGPVPQLLATLCRWCRHVRTTRKHHICVAGAIGGSDCEPHSYSLDWWYVL